MKLIHHVSNSNFGDVLNVPLARQIFGDIFDDDERIRFLFIGTMIGRKPPPETREVILGAGAGYKQGRYTLNAREIFCVRGPLTCRLLGLDEKYAAIDPAILCSRYFLAKNRNAERRGTLFIPHYSTDMAAAPIFHAACAELGLSYLSPREPVERIIAAIARSRRVMTEALHGAIVAEAYDVPWTPVVAAGYVMRLKWLDFCQTIGVEYKPNEIHLNVAFDRPPRMTNRLKHTAYQLGIGKPRYKYLPIRSARGDEAERLVAKLRPIVDNDCFKVGDARVKGRSIERLDIAIQQFQRTYGAVSSVL